MLNLRSSCCIHKGVFPPLETAFFFFSCSSNKRKKSQLFSRLNCCPTLSHKKVHYISVCSALRNLWHTPELHGLVVAPQKTERSCTGRPRCKNKENSWRQSPLCCTYVASHFSRYTIRQSRKLSGVRNKFLQAFLGETHNIMQHTPKCMHCSHIPPPKVGWCYVSGLLVFFFASETQLKWCGFFFHGRSLEAESCSVL